MLKVGEVRKAIEGLDDEADVLLITDGLSDMISQAYETSLLDSPPSAKAEATMAQNTRSGKLLISISVTEDDDEA